jgi:hypothetical protein
MVVHVRVRLYSVRRGGDLDSREVVSRLRLWLDSGSLAALLVGLWRLAFELKFTERFAIPDGLFSHWQVWVGLALLLQLLARTLGRLVAGGAATQ